MKLDLIVESLLDLVPKDERITEIQDQLDEAYEEIQKIYPELENDHEKMQEIDLALANMHENAYDLRKLESPYEYAYEEFDKIVNH